MVAVTSPVTAPGAVSPVGTESTASVSPAGMVTVYDSFLADYV